MKYIKAIGLAAMAMSLMAFVAGTASATTLDNGSGVMVSVGSSIDASLTGTAKLTDTSSETILETCTGGTIEGVTSNTGSATEAVRGIVVPENLTWSGCTSTTDTTGGGELEIHWISGTRNGTVTGTTFTVTANVFGVSCSYGFSSTDTMVDVGVLAGSDTEPVLAINTAVPRRAGGFLCPASARWIANYRVTTPSGLTVTES